MPPALGKNLRILPEFRRAVVEQGLSSILPDASNCGGVIGRLRAAELTRELGMPTRSRGIHELHVSLVSAQPHGGWIEVHSFPIDRYTIRPLQIERGLALAPVTSGTGAVFDRDRSAECFAAAEKIIQWIDGAVPSDKVPLKPAPRPRCRTIRFSNPIG